MGYVNVYVQIKGYEDDMDFQFETNLICKSVKDANQFVRMICEEYDVENYQAIVYQYMNIIKSERKFSIKQIDN